MNWNERSLGAPSGHRELRLRPCDPSAGEDADVAEAEAQQSIRDQSAIVAIAAGAVHDDRLIGGGLQYGSKVPVITRETFAREIERARHVSLLEEDRRARVEDERAFGIDRRKEFLESDGCRRCDFK